MTSRVVSASAILSFLLLLYALEICAQSKPITPFDPLPEIDASEYQQLRPVNVEYMLRGYCNAFTAFDDTNALGGHWVSQNPPHRIASEMNVPGGQITLLAFPHSLRE